MATALALPASRYEQEEVIAAIKQTVAKGASDAQLRMFLEVCKRTGLDPFLKEVWYVPEKGIVMAARDGYLRVANESPEFDGMETRVVRTENGIPIKAICTVWRKDRNHPIVCEAFYNEYAKSSPVWKQYPSAMISKVAEVLALKRSFAINGVVTEEEIGYDAPRGSVEPAPKHTPAQQQVIDSKLAARKGPQLAPAIAEETPEEYEEEDDTRYTWTPAEDEPTDLEMELHDSIVQAENQRVKDGKGHSSRFVMMESFQQLKERYASIGFAPTFGAILGRYGVKDATEFPATEDGMAEARCAYKEMSLDVANRVAKHAKRWGGR